MFNIYNWKSCRVGGTQRRAVTWNGTQPTGVNQTKFGDNDDVCVLMFYFAAVGGLNLFHLRGELCWSSQCTTHTIRTKLCNLSLLVAMCGLSHVLYRF